MTREEAINICERELFCSTHAECQHEKCPWNDRCIEDSPFDNEVEEAFSMAIEALKQPEVIRCHQCGYWDRDTLRHQGNDFRDWNEAECMVLAERDGYNEINRYVEADDYCSYAERREP